MADRRPAHRCFESDRGLGVAVDATGAVHDTISFHGTIDFGGGAITAANGDHGGVVVKYSP